MLKIVEYRYGGGWNIKEDLPEGWWKLVDEMEKELTGYTFEIWEAKEKWGQMRLYLVADDDQVYKIVSKYEDKSAEVCMICGKKKSRKEDFCNECKNKFR